MRPQVIDNYLWSWWKTIRCLLTNGPYLRIDEDGGCFRFFHFYLL